jgi:hypothetical protein
MICASVRGQKGHTKIVLRSGTFSLSLRNKDILFLTEDAKHTRIIELVAGYFVFADSPGGSGSLRKVVLARVL